MSLPKDTKSILVEKFGQEKADEFSNKMTDLVNKNASISEVKEVMNSTLVPHSANDR